MKLFIKTLFVISLCIIKTSFAKKISTLKPVSPSPKLSQRTIDLTIEPFYSSHFTSCLKRIRDMKPSDIFNRDNSFTISFLQFVQNPEFYLYPQQIRILLESAKNLKLFLSGNDAEDEKQFYIVQHNIDRMIESLGNENIYISRKTLIEKKNPTISSSQPIKMQRRICSRKTRCK